MLTSPHKIKKHFLPIALSLFAAISFVAYQYIASTSAQSDLSTGLLFHYDFENSQSPGQDISINENHAQVGSSVSITTDTSRGNVAQLVQGTGQSFIDTQIPTPAQSFTWSMWAKLSGNGPASLISDYSSQNSSAYTTIAMSPTDLTFNALGGTNGMNISPRSEISYTDWKHLTFTYDHQAAEIKVFEINLSQRRH